MIRVLIVDGSAPARAALTEALSAETDMEVDTAHDLFVAREKIISQKPDVITLDIEIPPMDALPFLKTLMSTRPRPVIVISGHCQSPTKAREALDAGAIEALAKPAYDSIGDLRLRLASRVRAAAGVPVSRPPVELQGTPAPMRRRSSVSMIAIGASTGGTDAIQEVVAKFPADVPPVLIVQHIPAAFSKAFAQRLDNVCSIRVKEAEQGDILKVGHALVAPGGYHMLVRKHAGGGFHVDLSNSIDPVFHQRPAVDVLFHSVAESAGSTSIGAVLTGMGADGARGLSAMKQAGAHTFAQDEASSVVFGMPKEAIRTGCVDSVLPLNKVAQGILRLC